MGPGKIREFNKLTFCGIVLEIQGGGIRIIEYLSASKCTAHIETGAHGIIRWEAQGEN